MSNLRATAPEGNAKEIRIECDGSDMFVIRDGVKIAKRGVGTWIPLEPGWEVVDCPGEDAIELIYNGVSVH